MSSGNLKLPKGWEVRKLGEICKIELGRTPYRKDMLFWDSKKQTDNVWLSIADLKNTKDAFIYDSKEYISNKALSASKIVKKGTLLLSFKLTIGRLAFAGRDLFTNEAIASLPIKNEMIIDKFYLRYYFLFFNWDKVLKGEVKVKGKTLNKAKLKELEVIIPPLPKQKHIVAILDKTFAEITKAETIAKTNLQNAKELFESYLNDIFKNKGDDWEEKTLGELGKASMCKRILKKQTSREGEVPFYKIGTFGKKPNAFISKEIYEEYKNKYSFPNKGDILLSASGTIGRCVIYNGKPAYFQDSNIVWIDNNEEKVLSEYLYKFYSFCDWNPSKGATISRLYNDDLRRIKIFFPKSQDKQKQIARKLDQLQAQTKKLEKIYQQKIDNLIKLKKSILQKVFNGGS